MPPFNLGKEIDRLHRRHPEVEAGRDWTPHYLEVAEVEMGLPRYGIVTDNKDSKCQGMNKYVLILGIIFLSCCTKQHYSATQTGTINASQDENDKTKPLMIGGKQFINSRYDLEEGSPERRRAFTLGDNLDEIKHIGLDIDPLDSSKMNSLEGIEQLYNAKNLESIWISGRNLDTIDFSPLERFANITGLGIRIWGSSHILPDLAAFQSLCKLTIRDVRFEQSYKLNLPPGLTNLTLDSVFDLPNVDLSAIETLHDLHRLWIAGDNAKLPDLTKLENLRLITLGSRYYDAALESLEGIGAPNAEEIRITNRGEIDSLAPLNNLLNLELLEIHTFTRKGEYKLENLPGLSRLEINIRNINAPIVLQGIENLTGLKHLDIGMNGTIDLQGIENLQYLEHLELYYPALVNFEGIGKLKNLNLLHMPLRSPEPSLEFLRNMPNLTELEFSGSRRNGEVYQVLDLAPLATLKNLREFGCSYFIIKNISALDGLELEDSRMPFIGLEGCRLYDETEKSRHHLVFDFSILSG
jgi:hypothetical protein